MSYIKRYFEDHVGEISDEELIKLGFANNVEEAQELRELLTGKKECVKES